MDCESAGKQASLPDRLGALGDRVSDNQHIPLVLEVRDEKAEVIELGVGDRTGISGSGGDRVLDIQSDGGAIKVGAFEVAPALKRAKIRKLRSKKVLDFTALKRAKQSKKSGQPHLPSRGQKDTDWLKTILPAPKSGAWWEAPADDKGFRIKLRWRAGGKKPVYAFARLGKKEVEKLKEKTYEEQKRALSGRIFRELYHRGDRAIADRIAPYAGSGEIASNRGA